MQTLEFEPANTTVDVAVERSLAQVKRPEMVAADPMMEMLATAVSNGNLELVKELYAFKKQVEEDEAKRAYVQAMADFKAEAIVVVKDKENKQYQSRYTSIGNLVNTVTPFLSKHGFSADWELPETGGIRVVCVMTHRLGYSKRFPITLPPDTSGAKNPLQQIKSSITYGKIVTFESACGLASKEGNADDDGNAHSGPKMPEHELVAALDAIRSARNDAELKQFFTTHYNKAKAIKDSSAQGDIINARDERKAQL